MTAEVADPEDTNLTIPFLIIYCLNRPQPLLDLGLQIISLHAI